MGILNVTSIAKPICVVWICMCMNLKGVYNKAAPDCIIWAPMDSFYENWPYSNQLWNKNKCESLKHRWAGQHPIRLLCFPPFFARFLTFTMLEKTLKCLKCSNVDFWWENQMKSWAFRVVGFVGWLVNFLFFAWLEMRLFHLFSNSVTVFLFVHQVQKTCLVNMYNLSTKVSNSEAILLSI